MRDKLDRRTFLRTGAVGVGGAVLLGGGSILAACGDDDDATTSSGDSETPDLGTLDFQLSWIKNVEFAGEYLAIDKGFYTDVGFSGVNLIAGGPTVQQDSVVASGRAFIGISDPDITSPAIIEGAPLKAVGAQYQKNPFAVMSMAANPISTPEDMIGKSIGVQAVNEPVWNAFLLANEIDPSDINKVPVQFDPQPLVAGEVDGWFSFFTNEPNLLRAQGEEVEVFLLADFNYPMVSEIYIVTQDSIDNDREKIKAILVADIRGWHESLADPAAGAHLAVTEHGSDLGLDEEEQTMESGDQNSLVLTDDTRENGLFTITDELVEGTISSLALGGVEITAEELFDLSLLAEVYDENPDLKEPPV